ncbi:MAG TPA: SPFH/Band 7/PHB domain protein, partial [Thermotoga sp.]|nr:SPFH/Band 7/PHB domain protein [Thermotoga sp.]
ANKYRVIVEAEAQAEAILKIFKAIHEGKPTSDLITIRYLEALKEIANGKATKIFLPMETSSVLASLGAISEIFKKEEGKQEE